MFGVAIGVFTCNKQDMLLAERISKIFSFDVINQKNRKGNSHNYIFLHANISNVPIWDYVVPER